MILDRAGRRRSKRSFARPRALTDFRFEIPDSRMKKILAFSKALESGIDGIWNRNQTKTAGL
jgi:hypothetical protein